jgi:hypothetical protein
MFLVLAQNIYFIFIFYFTTFMFLEIFKDSFKPLSLPAAYSGEMHVVDSISSFQSVNGGGSFQVENVVGRHDIVLLDNLRYGSDDSMKEDDGEWPICPTIGSVITTGYADSDIQTDQRFHSEEYFELSL